MSADVYKLTCPVCFAAAACAELQRALERRTPVVERSGMARGMLESLAGADRGWRFCDAHTNPHTAAAIGYVQRAIGELHQPKPQLDSVRDALTMARDHLARSHE